jgi:hypothetical protein
VLLTRLCQPRAKIAYAKEVVAKLGGDPDLFWEPEPEAARQTSASTGAVEAAVEADAFQ